MPESGFNTLMNYDNIAIVVMAIMIVVLIGGNVFQYLAALKERKLNRDADMIRWEHLERHSRLIDKMIVMLEIVRDRLPRGG